MDLHTVHEWQNLFGALIGVLGAFAVTIFGLILNHLYQTWKEKRRIIRETEIALALSGNDIYDAQRHLRDFIDRLNIAVITPLQRNVNPGSYFLQKTNFPHLSIHLNTSLLTGTHSSYYVHNKLLIIHKNLKQMNQLFVDIKEEYKGIYEMTCYLISRGTAENQREEYLRTNESFVEFLEDLIKQLEIAKKTVAEAKVYNLKFVKKHRIELWKNEGISFKFFKTSRQIGEFRSSPTVLDRIDNAIKEEVISLIDES